MTSPASLFLLRGRLPAIDNVGCGLMISLLENTKHGMGYHVISVSFLLYKNTLTIEK